MTPRQQRFAQEYLVDLNCTEAAIRAGYSKKTARQIGSRLLSVVDVSKAITTARQSLELQAELGALGVLQRWAAIATANPNEIIQHRRAPCRHCHGKDGAYQWKTPREFAAAVEEAMLAQTPLPSDAGGYDYSTKAPINPGCRECHGDGIGYTIVADTRHLSPRALALYAGVKQTKDGIEIKMQDQGKALENIARHLGMFDDAGRPPPALDDQRRRELRQALLRELADLAKPTSLVIDQDGRDG